MSEKVDATAAPKTAAEFAEALRKTFLNNTFGIIKFWGFGVVRPNDQFYELVSTHADGDRLDLVFVHDSRSGLPGVISIWNPDGLEAAPEGVGQGIAIQSATRLKMDDNEAVLEGAQFRLKTPRGEGLWPMNEGPALVLAR